MKRGGGILSLALVTVFLGGYVLYPLAKLALSSLSIGGHFSFQHYRSLLDPSNAANLEAVVNSVGVSLLSVLFSGLLGVFFAFAFTQVDFRFRLLLSRLATIPIALPPLVGVIAFLFVYGESGIIPRSMSVLTGLPPSSLSLDGIPAIVAIHVYSFNIYFYLFAASTLRQIDGSMLEAASVLGSSSWRTFWRIVVPQLRPALLGAGLLTFMVSMASFSAPYLFAGARRFLTLQIYATKLNGEVDLASAQSILLMIVSLGFFVLLTVLGRTGDGRHALKGSSSPGTLVLKGWARAAVIGLAAFLVALEILPLLVILLISFAKEGSWTWQLLPSRYTLENYLRLGGDTGAFVPVVNSLLMALLAVGVALIVGLAGAWLVQGLGKRRILLDALLTSPFAIPGTVAGLALILAFSVPTVFGGYRVLVGTFWILPLAYVIRTYPLVHRAASSALARLDPSLIEAAGTLGAGPWRRGRTVVLPLILPAVLSGALLVLIAALGEFVSSILLYAYSSRPISIEILAQLRSFSFGVAAVYCVILLVLTLVFVFIAGRLSERVTFTPR